ncbi:hypothetical protein HDU86_000043 [Geranomyces michiganensis]|nr:hypothetical protein HDU86_000043 [Geranomyces michiganensis]
MDRVFVPRWSTIGPAGTSNGNGGGGGTGPASSGVRRPGSGGNALSHQGRSRTISASSALGALGTKDIILGPGGGTGRSALGPHQHHHHASAVSPTSPVLAPSTNGNASSASSSSLHHNGGRRGERRDRNTSQNGFIPLSAWKAPVSGPSGGGHTGTAFAAARQQQQQPSWPQLSSATLGAFSKPPVPVSAPTDLLDGTERRTNDPPISFENNFPSLSGGAASSAGKSGANGNAGTTAKPAAAWGKPDVAAIVSSRPPAGAKSEPEVDSTAEDEEAAEIARLKALIPRLDKGKGHAKGMSSLRERSKSVSGPKLPFSALNGRPATLGAQHGNGRPSILAARTSAMSNPVAISNRPKLRSTMKASPREASKFPKEMSTTDSRPAADGDGPGGGGNGGGGEPPAETPSPDHHHHTDAWSSENSRGSSTNGEDLFDRDGRETASPEVLPTHHEVEKEETKQAHDVDAGIFALDPVDDIFLAPSASSAPMAAAAAGARGGSAWSSRSTSPSPGTPDSDSMANGAHTRSSSHDYLESDSHDDSDRSCGGGPQHQQPQLFMTTGLTSTASAPLGVSATTINSAEQGSDFGLGLTGAGVGLGQPRPAPYESTFQYSASLEKEESFLRTLGWDKSAYYDSDVDEKEFVITQEEKEEFFKGYSRLCGGDADADATTDGERHHHYSSGQHQQQQEQVWKPVMAAAVTMFDTVFASPRAPVSPPPSQQNAVARSSRHVRLVDETTTTPLVDGFSRFPTGRGLGAF